MANRRLERNLLAERSRQPQTQTENQDILVKFRRQHGPLVHPSQVSSQNREGNIEVQINGGLTKVEMTASDMFVKECSRAAHTELETREIANRAIEAAFIFWEEYARIFAERAIKAMNAAKEEERKNAEEQTAIEIRPEE
jgi:hypothetical protein